MNGSMQLTKRKGRERTRIESNNQEDVDSVVDSPKVIIAMKNHIYKKITVHV